MARSRRKHQGGNGIPWPALAWPREAYQYPFGRGAEHMFLVWVCMLNSLAYSVSPGTKSQMVWHPERETKHCKLNREADCLSSWVAEAGRPSLTEPIRVEGPWLRFDGEL
jgi:hypothetical protein